RRLSESGALGVSLGKAEESTFQLQTGELEALGASLSRLFQFQGEDLAPERELVIILDVSKSNSHAKDELKADLFATIEGLTAADDRPLRVAVIGTELTNTSGTRTIMEQQESPLLTVSGDEGVENLETLSDFYDGLTFGVGQTQIDDAIRYADDLLLRDEEVQQQVIVIATSGGEGTAQIKAEAASAARAFSAGSTRRNLSAIGATRTRVGDESTPSTYFQKWLVPAGGGNSETYVRGELHFEDIFRDVSSRAGEINSLDLSSGLRAQESLQSIDQAIARVGGARAQAGAMWWRHETRRRVHGRGVGLLSQRLAAQSAADIAAEVSQLKQAQGGLESIAKVRAAQQSLYGETLLTLLG
ncbi:MAG: hypothetical protein VYD19_11505, partial [Myxococcota bacterium]|nr:hypothetical protein [Myxococcota bacterium]